MTVAVPGHTETGETSPGGEKPGGETPGVEKPAGTAENPTTGSGQDAALRRHVAVRPDHVDAARADHDEAEGALQAQAEDEDDAEGLEEAPRGRQEGARHGDGLAETAAGRVALMDGSKTLKTLTLKKGKAEATLALAAGTQRLSARFLGSAGAGASKSATVVVKVARS